MPEIVKPPLSTFNSFASPDTESQLFSGRGVPATTKGGVSNMNSGEANDSSEDENDDWIYESVTNGKE